MRRLAAFLILASGGLLLTSSAPGVETVPGDPTPPVVTPVITGSLGASGWYVTNVTVRWDIVDPESIILETEGCDTRTLAADTAATNLRCRALSDGGETSVAKVFKVDKTAPSTTAAPSRAPDSNGWYNSALTVGFGGSDATSGLDSCSAPRTYAGPDAAVATVTGTCSDVAGNTAPASLPLKYDATAPSASPAARAPDANGWHNHAVTVTFQGSDSTSGVQSCSQMTYAGPDDPSVALAGTCLDQAGNRSSSSVFTLKYDETDPAATATASRPADVNGWYNAPLTVSFGASDAISGVDSCDAPKTYSGPNSTGTSVAGSCRDRAGNVATPSVSLKYDASGPTVTATPARAANANGWYNAAVGVSFAGADPTSGVASCEANKTYSGPDSGTAAVAGTCTDNAGNTGSGSFSLKYDATAPQATATPSRQPNAAGWYTAPLTVSFPGTDATSGIASCTAPQSYNGPDNATASIAGSCQDNAGNSTARTLDFKYDATAPQLVATPSRPPNASTWYTAALTVSFPGTDATSGIASCTPQQSYNGPDNAAASIGGSCQDNAGNTTTRTLGFKYDATAPQLAATPSRGADANGWYNHELTVTFPGTDATSGIESCTAGRNYNGPDTATASVAGSCQDKAGNTTARTLDFRYDASVPQVTTTPARQPNGAGWYNAPLSVSFAGSDPTAGVESCDLDKSYSGPDSATAAVVGTCRDKAGNVGAGSLALKYDATAPQVATSPERAPNANGWYRAPLTVGFSGTDPTSGVASCDASQTYSGPDNAAAALIGTCRDSAGNTGSGSFPLKYDATAPQASATPSRQANAGGWYNASLAVSFAGTDATSGVDSCDAPKTYSGPDSASASLSGTCRDKAGNPATASYALKYDATAPQVATTPARAANASGWYTAPVSVSFAGTDATSGIGSCDADKPYAGPDSATASVGGSCSDRAGNAGSGSLSFKYDATAPAATATASRQPNSEGWYNAPLTVSFAASDPVSGLASCPAQKSYGGPDTASGVVSGTCLDNAGNGGLASLALKYDATAPQAAASPSRAPNGNGWYREPLTVGFEGADLTSGIAFCDAAKSYAGPDTSSTSLSGACRDRAGNPSASASFSLKYDATAPVVTHGVPVRPPDHDGWYNKPVAFALQGTDETSGIDGSCSTASYAGPDSATASYAGACDDKAGNRGFKAFPLKYDATGPVAVASPSRGPDVNGWYNQPLSVSFSGGDPVSGLESCAPPESYGGPDSSAAIVGGLCLDRAGNAALASLDLRYDSTPPQVAGATPSRAPDANGWYNAPLSVTFHGTDATSEIEACTGAQYAGPDAGAASVAGSCHDRAGNGSAAASFPLRYDATRPSLTGVTVKSGNGTAVLSWTASADTTLVEIRRAAKVVYRGTGRTFTERGLENGVRHRYTFTGYDEAMNAATAEAVASPSAPLMSPKAGAVVSAPPLLVWKAVPKTRYYNVQLLRRGRIFSAWPTRASLQLKRTWIYKGRRYRLTPGRYRWYVWPGRGRPVQKTFGPLIGSSSFVVR